MAVMRRGQVRTAIRHAIDDPLGNLWPDANLDVLTEMVEDTMFQAILDTWPWFLSTTESKAPDAAGKVPLSNLTNRFYRILDVKRTSDGLRLLSKLPNESIPQNAYYIIGGDLVTDPIIAGPATIDITYSFLPPKYTGLANDATELPNYPEGHESALIYLTAAWAMTKGDRESITQIARVANQAVEALLRHIANRYPSGSSANINVILERIMRNPLPS